MYGSFQVSNPLGWDILDALGASEMPLFSRLAQRKHQKAQVSASAIGLQSVPPDLVWRHCSTQGYHAPQPNQDLKGSSPQPLHGPNACIYGACYLTAHWLCVVFGLFVSGFCLLFLFLGVFAVPDERGQCIGLCIGLPPVYFCLPLQQWPLRYLINQLFLIANMFSNILNELAEAMKWTENFFCVQES